MSLGALAGFALVFVATAWTASALGTLALGRARSRLRRSGPMAERRAAEAAAIVPVVLGVLVVAALLVQSAVGVDHCDSHGHHAHLCLVHGGMWIERTWVVVVLAITSVTMLARGVLVVASLIRGARSIHALHELSRDAGDVRLVDSERAFCFVANRTRPTIYVSSRVWSALPARQREALVAHEAAHVRHGDLRMRAVLEAFLVFAVPLAGGRIRSTWMHASERMCDSHAATVTEPATVASAMVAMCRLHAMRPVPTAFAVTPRADELEGRVQAVLVNGPIGDRAARRVARSVMVGCGAFAVAVALAAEPLHHAFETLLG